MGYVRVVDGSKATRCAKLCVARAFLGHLSEEGECEAWAPMLASDRFARYSECYQPAEAWDVGGSLDSGGLLAAIGEFMALVDGEGYSVTMRKSFRKSLEMLYIALAVNGARYTPRNADAWLDANEARFGSQAQVFRRAHFLFQGFLVSGGINPRSVRGGLDDPMGDFPAWARAGVSEYLEIRAREGFAPSTVGCMRRALLRFASYADSRGVRSWGDLAPGIVSDWCLEDPHSTAEGRTCYTAKVRCFLEHLGDEGSAPRTLSLAVCSKSAPRREIVRVLDDEQVDAAATARRDAETPMELRDAAIVALGLTMGLRASDALGIGLADISWKESCVAVVQRKTLRQVGLPLTAAAGNAIIRYVRDGRPACTSSTALFVGHRVPYAPLTKSACRAACRRTFGDDVTFHDLRRTFATRMLRGGTGRRGVAEAFGHSDEGTVDEYLSVDDERMLMCAMPLSELGLGAPDGR